MDTASTSGEGKGTWIELPKLDGYLEAGIAAGIDPTLPDEDKLPIFGKTTREIYNSAVSWAENRNFQDDRTNTLFVTGVAAIVGCGMLRTRNGIPDGDGYESNTAHHMTPELARITEERITKDSLTHANTVVCATKVNYWLMNHHVGQTGDKNIASGYVQKVLVMKYNSPLPNNMVRAVHMLGHYASTRFILSRADIPNILTTERRCSDDVYEIRFAEDAKLRFRAPPAGTHRMAVCHEAARRLSKYQFAHFCPDVAEFSVLPKWKATIMANPAIFHIGALYLTGTKDDSFVDNVFDSFIGRLGTFIQVVASRSTLCNSPHFQPERVESAPDFSSTWRSILTQINRARETLSAQQITMEDVQESCKEAVKELSAVFSETTPTIRAPTIIPPN
jgi:hypothetical protein